MARCFCAFRAFVYCLLNTVDDIYNREGVESIRQSWVCGRRSFECHPNCCRIQWTGERIGEVKWHFILNIAVPSSVIFQRDINTVRLKHYSVRAE